MKTSTYKSAAKKYSITIALILGLATPVIATTQANEDDLFKALEKWQSNRLFQPTPDERVREQQGEVVIYDGLTEKTIEKALNQNFDRIQNMMFTRVQRTDAQGKVMHDRKGNVVTEDDGC